MVEKPLHGAGVAGGDAQRAFAVEQRSQPRILAGGHFAQVGHTLEGGPGFAEALENGVFDGFGDRLGEGAAAIEDPVGGVVQGGKEGGDEVGDTIPSKSVRFNPNFPDALAQRRGWVAGLDPAPPAAPTDLRLVRGILSGTAVARYRTISPTRPNEVETTTGDPNEESAWTRYGIFPRGRAELSGFTPGALLWVRVRTLGLKGVVGPWSDPAQVRLG